MSSEPRSNHDMIGRADVNDVDAILAITNIDVDEVLHGVESSSDAIFTWDYERTRAALSKLYEKAKTSQWNANDLAVGHDGRTRSTSCRGQPGCRTKRSSRNFDLTGHAGREVGRGRVDRTRDRVAELDPLAVHAR